MRRIGHTMIKGILFDKDGTLFDFNASWGAWARQFIDGYTPDQENREALARAFKYDYEAQVFEPDSAVISGTSNEIFSAMQSVFPEQSAAQIADVVRASTASAKLAPVCDLPDYLGALKEAGYRLGVATNDNEASARAQLAHEDADGFFDFFAGYDSGFGAKPAPGMCNGFLRAFGLAPEEAIMVGDSAFDILAGKAAGMRTVGVLTGAMGEGELAEADVVLRDITEIPDWLNSFALKP